MVKINKPCNNITKPSHWYKLSKLRNNTSLIKTLKMTYHSLFLPIYYDLNYATGAYKLNQPKQNTKATKQNLEKKVCLKNNKILLGYYKELEILNCPAVLYLQHCLFMTQIETNQKLANSLADLKHCGDSHNYQTKLKTK